MNAYTPVRFVTFRQVDRRPEGFVVTERWSDGTQTQRVMGKREQAAWLANQGRRP
jgi:hypothetical protein